LLSNNTAAQPELNGHSVVPRCVLTPTRSRLLVQISHVAVDHAAAKETREQMPNSLARIRATRPKLLVPLGWDVAPKISPDKSLSYNYFVMNVLEIAKGLGTRQGNRLVWRPDCLQLNV